MVQPHTYTIMFHSHHTSCRCGYTIDKHYIIITLVITMEGRSTNFLSQSSFGHQLQVHQMYMKDEKEEEDEKYLMLYVVEEGKCIKQSHLHIKTLYDFLQSFFRFSHIFLLLLFLIIKNDVNSSFLSS